MNVDMNLSVETLLPAVQQCFQVAAEKTRQLDTQWDAALGAPVFTLAGRYGTRGWTQWTEGFQYGCLILAGDGLDDVQLLELGRARTIERMLPHVTHIGVHDHGFNTLSTYGNLLRLLHGGRLGGGPDLWQQRTYENAIATSGAVQAARWSATACGLGYIYSFNGPHSLFIDTMRTLRALAVAHQLGHVLKSENDVEVNLLGRLIQHALATSKYLVFHGETDQTYDVRGRTAHEGTFNRNDGNFRARATQQGYSPFSTWTRGLAWAVLGYAEQLEFFQGLDDSEFERAGGFEKQRVVDQFLSCAMQTSDHYIDDVTAADGITYWDDGAPQLYRLGDWHAVDAEPKNGHEPVDASASAIAAQGLLRLGHYLGPGRGQRYWQAGLSVAKTLFGARYLSTDLAHQGLLLHSVYHWPNHWDYVPPGGKVAQGESSMWGDYHLLELALLIQRMGNGGTYPTFFLPA